MLVSPQSPNPPLRLGWLCYLSSVPAAGYSGGAEVCSPSAALHSPCPVVLHCCGSPGFPCEALRWPWSLLWVFVSYRGPRHRWLLRTLWANRVSHDWEVYQLQCKKTLAQKTLLICSLNHCLASVPGEELCIKPEQSFSQSLLYCTFNAFGVY